MNTRAKRCGARLRAVLLVGGLSLVALSSAALVSVTAGARVAAADIVGPVAKAEAPLLVAPGSPTPVAAVGGASDGDSFDPTMRAAVALVLVGLFAATRSGVRARR